MNKKVIIGIIAALVVVGAGIYAINGNNSKSDNDSSQVSETSNNGDDNNSTDTNSENANTTENSNNSQSNSENPTGVKEENAQSMEELDAASNAEIATNNDTAVKKLIDFYLGKDNAFTQNTTKVKFVKNADNTVTVTKTTEDSNIYYAGYDELSPESDGIILTIESYDEAKKTYTYTIKDYAKVKSGNTTDVADSGTIPEKGSVEPNQKNK